jgi:hypothetical protein
MLEAWITLKNKLRPARKKKNHLLSTGVALAPTISATMKVIYREQRFKKEKSNFNGVHKL